MSRYITHEQEETWTKIKWGRGMKNVISWCDERLAGSWVNEYDTGYMYFKHEEDAVAFKLRFRL